MHKIHKKHILETYQPQSGRSMVEMLGSMAIMGVLSVGAIGGYSYAMNKHRTNELIYEATKRAQWVGTQLELNRDPANLSILGFGTNKFAGGEIYGVSDLIDNQFEIQIKDVTEAVCENLIRNSGDNNIIRFVVNPDTHEEISTRDCTDSIKVGLVFNRDLSTNDPTENPEVSGEVSGEATGIGPEPEATATATAYEPEESATVVPCSGNGTWSNFDPLCECNFGWGGSDCSVENPCSGHGLWFNCGGGFCRCEEGYAGDNCSKTVRAACAEHGVWIDGSTPGDPGYCTCNSGWHGNYCLEEDIPEVTVLQETTDPEETATGTGDYEPEETATGTGQNESIEPGDPTLGCGEHGVWIYWSPDTPSLGGYCSCDFGWGGDTCTIENPCGVHGNWNSQFNVCSCNDGWGGTNCSIENPCSGNGEWHNYANEPGSCRCSIGWGSSDCSEVVCSGHGYWSQSYNNGAGGCSCDSDWGGSDCSISKSCSGHGSWSYWDSKCTCQSGWEGDDCSASGREIHCSNHGTWNGSNCTCDSGWGYSDCSKCSGHGTWGPYDSKCSCNSGWGGSDCSLTDRAACSEHGTWIVNTSRPNGGFCACDSGYTGTDCSTSFRAIYCNDHGTFIVDTSKPSGGFCDCDSGYTGSDCSTPN